jgi:uncharacterized protein with GYD domain
LCFHTRYNTDKCAAKLRKGGIQGIEEYEGIKDVYHAFGEYDFVVIIEVKDLSILNSVVDRIRESETVTATQTIVGAEL